MRVSGTKTAPRVEGNLYNLTRKIKLYGKDNAYPQKILQIIGSSGTGTTCYNVYTKFVYGAGFADKSLAESLLNPKETANSLLKKCSKDFKSFNGFALLIKYNGALEQESIHSIPFEHCRLEINGDKKLSGRIAVHPDWTGELGLAFKIEDIRYINSYDPLKVQEEMTAAGGPEKYLGQIFYYTASGDFEYPVCPFDPIVTDMLTEESVSTVKHRNAKYNFLPAGALVRKGIRPNTISDTDDSRKDENEESREEIKRWQGDENACKLLVVDIDSDEEMPTFIPFDGKNYDRQYEYTERTVQENIGKMFFVPPILRGVDVGAGFGADLMINAYDFMNSVVAEERQSISSVFKKILSASKTPFTNTDILPLKYIANDISGNTQ